MSLVVTSPSFSKHPELQKELLSHFPDAKLNIEGRRLKADALYHYIGDAEVAIVGLEKVDSAFLDACSNIKFVSKYGVGLDNIDIEECQKRNIGVGWQPGVNKTCVAEVTLGFALSLMHNLYMTSNLNKKGQWLKEGGQLLSSKVFGVIGCGHVGLELIRLLEPFGCKILVNDIVDVSAEIKNFENVQVVNFEQCISESDVLSLHVPYTNLTDQFMNADVFSNMKSSAYLINTARGSVVDQEALKSALENGDVAGAALDVYQTEPCLDSELLAMPNVICTPHIGGNAKEAVYAMGMAAIQNILEWKANG